MARYLVTSGSNFTPLTYEEMVRPIQAADTAHEAVTEAYDKMSMDTQALERYISQTNDPEAYRLYSNYMTKLKTLQDNLWKNGITAQTRRELSAARNAYASDVARVQKAIEARQTRSKEYWDNIHKGNGDTLASTDPGLSSLDLYLSDDNYGQNWWSYSKSAMAKEVADDLSAQAVGLLRTGQAPRGSEVAGKILRYFEKGFTNAELARVSSVVRAVLDNEDDVDEKINSLDKFESMMAATISAHIIKSGATSADITPATLRELTEAAIAGASKGVLAPELKYFDDPEDELRRKKELIDYQNGIKDPQPVQSRIGTSNDLESPGYRALVKETKSESSYYRDSSGNATPVTLIGNGQSVQVPNEYAMADYLYHGANRDTIRARLGIDPALDASVKQEGVIASGAEGAGTKIVTGRLSAADAQRLGLDPATAIGVWRDYGGNRRKLDDHYTLAVSAANQEIRWNLEDIKANNPHIADIEKRAVSPKKQKELRDKYDYPATESWSNFYNYVSAIETVGTYPSVVLSGADPVDKGYMEIAMRNAFQQKWNSPEVHGKPTKGDKYAIREVDENGKTVKESGLTDIGKILGTRNDGTVIWDNMVNFTNILEKFAENEPTVRFQSDHTHKTYEVSADYFGDIVSQNLRALTPAMQQLAMPILRPKEVMRMSRADSQRLGDVIAETLKSWSGGATVIPTVQEVDGDGNPVRVRNMSAKEIMLSPRYREVLYTALHDLLLDPQVTGIRKAVIAAHEQYRGNSNAKAE